MEKVLKCMTVLVLFWGISMFVDFGGVKHQNFNSGFPQEKALSVLEVKPARIVHQGDYEVLLYAQLIPPGTTEYRFNNGKFVKRQYVPNKSPNEY